MQLLEFCASAKEQGQAVDAQDDPRNLKQVLNRTTQELGAAPDNFADISRELWRLLRFLRASPGGCDTMHVSCKPQSWKLNWHQWLEREAALIAEGSNARTGRLASWRYLASKACATLVAEVPESIASGDVILAQSPVTEKWVPAVVLTVWRSASKNVRPSPRDLPIGCVHGVRIVQLQQICEKKYGCTALSPCFQIPFIRVCCRLEVRSHDPCSDGFRVTLSTQASRTIAAADTAEPYPEKFLKLGTDALQAGAAVAAAPQPKRTKKGSKDTEIPARAENFTRFLAGQQLIRQELKKLKNLDDKLFPDSPAFNGGDVFVHGSGKISWEQVLQNAPEYFSRHFS